MADPRQDAPPPTERERQIRLVVGTLNNLANAAEGRNPRRALERAVSKSLAMATDRHIKQEVEEITKDANLPDDALAIATRIEGTLGSDWVDFEPETLVEAGFSLQEAGLALCAKLVLYSWAPFAYWHVFEKIAVALAGRHPDFTLPQELTLEELAWAVDVIRLIDPATPFSDEINSYVACVAINQGWAVLPDALGFAGSALRRFQSDHGRQVADQVRRGEETDVAEIQRERLGVLDRYLIERHKRLAAALVT